MSRKATTTFGHRFTEARLAAGLTQEQMARQVGVTLRVVQRWSSGEGEPSAESLARICSVLGRPVEFFYPEEPVPA